MFRVAAVRCVAAQQLELNGRLNISGIAASTGIPRPEISRILKSTSKAPELEAGHRHQSTYKVLAAWHENPKFTNPNGQPANLKLYGRGMSFEALVKKYGGGIPTRAMLDELTRTGAIEVKSRQLVQLKSLVSVERGMTPQVIKAFGDRTTELLSTLLQNMRNPQSSVFVASVNGTKIPWDKMPLVRQQLSARGSNFLAEIGDVLAREPGSRPSSRKTARASNVSVTVFLNESRSVKKKEASVSRKRRNFRRYSRP